MSMEGLVKCSSPQNTLGVSGVNRVAAKSNRIKLIGDQIKSNVKKLQKKT